MSETWQQAERRRSAEQIEAIEATLKSLHMHSFQPARQQQATPAKVVDESALRAAAAKESGLTELESQIEKYGSPPKAPEPEPVDRKSVISSFQKPALREVPLIRLSERREVRAVALESAEKAISAEEQRRAQETRELQSELDRKWEDVQTLRSRVEAEVVSAVQREKEAREGTHRLEQDQLDREWAQLLANDPAMVERSAKERFSLWSKKQDFARVQSVGVTGSQVSVIVIARAPESVVPEQRADVTGAGRQTVKKRTQTDRNHLYLEAVSSAALAIAKAAFAAGPNLERALVLILQEGQSPPLPIYCGVISRDMELAGRYPSDVALSAEEVCLRTSGRTEKLVSVESELPAEARAVYQRVISTGVKR